MIIYNLDNSHKKILKLPLVSRFLDMGLCDADTVIQMGECSCDISRYADDYDERSLKIMKYKISVMKNQEDLSDNEIIELLDDYTGIYTTETFLGFREAKFGKGGKPADSIHDRYLKYPIFNSYGYYWPKDLGVTAYSSGYLMYCEDYQGVCVGSAVAPTIGDAMYYFALPANEGMDEKCIYYFNERKGI